MYFVHLREELNEIEYGAKASNLSFLLRSGVSVPSGYVLGSRIFLEKNEILKNSVEFKEHIKAVSTTLASEYVMVRSSAVGEDSEEFSFAGQLDSFITKNDPEEIFFSIFKCWKSLENARSQQYGDSLGQQLTTMGVIVQEMIEPDFSGVLFTHSPHNPNEGLVEWVTGHCEKLVSGEVTPETRKFSREIENIEAPFNFQNLSEESKRIFELYKKPQDIEWAIKEDKLFIVQSRPITNLKTKVNWSNTNVNENYPDKLAPFLYSLARTSYYHYFKNLTLKLGVYPKRPASYEHQFANIIGMWGQRMYYNMSSIHGILELTPFENLFKKSFDDFVGYQKESTVSEKLVTNLKKAKFSFLLFKNCLGLESKVRSIENCVDEFYALCKDTQDITAYSKAYHQFLNIRFNEWNKASFADMFAMVTHGMLGKVCKVLEPSKAQGIQNELLQAIPNLISNKPIFEMYKIYEEVSHNEELKALFLKDASEIWQELQEKNNHAYKMIQNYLETWGFRCSGELTFLSDNYIDNPLTFIQMLKIYTASNPQEPENLFLKKRHEQELLLDKTRREALRSKKAMNIFLGLILSPLVRLTSYSISCRERVRLKQAKLYFGAKLVMEKFAKFLVKKKVLETKKDIFFLDYQEVSRLFSGEEIDSEYIRDLVKLRRVSYERANQKADNFATNLEDFKNEIIKPDVQASEGDLVGLPACGGEIEGVVKVLESMHEIGKLQKGDILVTRQTDPGWICAFPMISGLLVERGGMLSHGAIVAREFGIPAVVGVENVTSLLKDGQRVHINAYSGVIKCLD